MRREIDGNEAIGKTIENIVYSWYGPMLIGFTDGTFTVFDIVHHRDNDAEIHNSRLVLFDFGDDLLIKAGIITGGELEALRNERDAECQRLKEARERVEYERLRKKFEEATDDQHR